MIRPRVYVETTIPSFYYQTRTQPNLVAWRDLTREWWSDAAEQYELLTSFTVRRELAKGTSGLVRLRLELLEGIPLLASAPEIDQIVEVYLQHRFDAAQAQYGGCDAPRTCLLSRLRFHCDVELPTPGESKRGDPHPANQLGLGLARSGTRDAAGSAKEET